MQGFNFTQGLVMSNYKRVEACDHIESINVIIEIPADDAPVKYEFDKDNGILSVDRFVATQMRYPVNYGFIPQTLSDDGDPADVLVITPYPLKAGSLIKVRAIGMLSMTDESGVDAKILALPISKLTKIYDHINDIDDVDQNKLAQIEFFFQNYKALEPGKWVELDGWKKKNEAIKEIENSIKTYEQKLEDNNV